VGIEKEQQRKAKRIGKKKGSFVNKERKEMIKRKVKKQKKKEKKKEMIKFPKASYQ
jgi:hypothetical protein